MSIQLTEKAAQHILRALSQRGGGEGVRISVVRSGCSGLGYRLSFADNALEDDLVIQDQSIKVFVAKKDLAYVEGLVLDFVQVGVNEGFRFNNPQAKGACRCGKSFSV